MNLPRFKVFPHLLVVAGICALLVFYGLSKYQILDNPINSIELKFKQEVSKKDAPIVFISKNAESDLDLKNPIKHTSFKDSVMNFQFDAKNKIRKVRVYFVNPNDSLLIESVTVISSKESFNIPLKKAQRKSVRVKEVKGIYNVVVYEKYGFLELPKAYIYASDFKNSYIFIGAFLCIIALVLLLLHLLQPYNIKINSARDVTIVLFLFSIFLPHPIFNITLILLLLFHLRKISWEKIRSNKVNLLFIGFFVIYLLNNLFISQEGYKEMSTIERILPISILSLIVPSIAKRKYLIVFVYSACALGCWFLLTSAFDVYVHGSFNFLSFNLFTKYLHPIYFSYLVFFSVLYVETKFSGVNKYFVQLVLILFLVFSGSKMVLIASVFVLGLKVFRFKKRMILIIPAGLALVVFLFTPLKERFEEILNKEDLTVLKEEKIAAPNDPRINGVTVRLILWREALNTMGIKDVFTGKGVTRKTDEILQEKLTSIGLEHHKYYNVHNQFVDTFWRTGIIGFILLLGILILGILEGIKRKDNLILIFCMFVFFVMLSESVFERVNGIYFFTATLLFIANSLREKA